MSNAMWGFRDFLCYRKPVLSAAVATLALPGFITPALAQDAPAQEVVGPASAQESEEIVVTATRREMSVLDVPYNISAVGAEALENAAVGDFSDLTRLVPGVSYTDTGSRNAGNATTFVLRGVNADSVSANADFATQRAPTVSTYLNETPLFFEMNLDDIERVEVLRGPQGTLYGSGAVGGTVRVITRQPRIGAFEFETGAEAATTEGGDWSYGASGVINVPISDSIAFRGSVNYDDVGGFIDAPIRRALDSNGAALPDDPLNPITSDPLLAPRDNVNESDSLAVRGALLFEPNDGFSALLTHHHQTDEGVGRQAIHPTLGDGDDLYNVIDEPFERTVDVTSLEAQIDFGFATLTSATSLANIDTEVSSDFSDQVTTNFAPYYYYNTYPRLIAREDDTFKDEVFTQEFRLASRGGEFIDWLGGLYFQRMTHETRTRISLPGVTEFNNLPGQTAATQLFNLYTGLPLDTDLVFLGNSDWENEEVAAFGEITLNITDDWQITGGARVFNNRFSVTTNDEYLGNPTGNSGSTDVTDSIFKLNTSYDLTPDHMFYATWSQGFRRGGANSLSPFDPPEFGSYESDTADNYEIGLKGTLADGRIRYTTAAYLITWDNIQVSTFTPFATAIVANGEGARNTGFELELSGDLTDDLQFSFGYNFVDARLEGAFVLPDVTAPDGARLPGVPRHMATVALDYETPLSFWEGASFGWHLGGSYRSEVISGFDDTPFDIEAFAIWNASASLNQGGARWTLFVDNVFDEQGITGGIGETLGPLGQYRYVSRPRTVGLRLNVNWNE